MASPLILRSALDDRPVSAELRRFLEELAAMSGKLRVEFVPGVPDSDLPWIRTYREDGAYTGLAFHGVPGGHEFNAFAVGLYNAAGPGQALDDAVLARIRAIRRPVSMKILVSLSCAKCPELVMAAQRIAAENPQIGAEIYDLNHFPGLRKQYEVMSVPCLIMDTGAISFGKKNIQQVLE
ncbi:MAG: thioredoxin family protein, partial [Spirochaetaceae bacterium]|nr:thioredoxin family protein [Spirochaetaceae bacterium]